LAIFDFTSAVIWLSGTACVVEAVSDVGAAAAGAGDEPGDELSAMDGAMDGVGNDGAGDGSLLLSLPPLVVSAEATRVPEEVSLLRDLATRRSVLSEDDLALADFD
jgi:hypothetical protein